MSNCHRLPTQLIQVEAVNPSMEEYRWEYWDFLEQIAKPMSGMFSRGDRQLRPDLKLANLQDRLLDREVTKQKTGVELNIKLITAI